MKRSLALAILLSGLPAAGPAQRPTAGETVEVSIVNVDVFVTDKAGNRVRALTREDFEVFENGIRQPITNFAEYAATDDPLPLAGEGARRAGEGQVDRQRRTIAVFVERFRLPKVHADPVFTSMKKLLRGAVRPGNAVTVVTWYKGRLTTVQTYTDDLAAIERALNTIARQNTSATLDDFANQRTWYDDIEDYDLTAEEMAGGDPGLVAAIRESAEDSREMSSRMNARRERWDLELKVATINALMRSMSGFDGKRFLLLATHRLSQIAGAEHLYAAGANAELDSLDRVELDTRKIMKTLYDTANANGVAVYPMFPEGIIAAPRISPEGFFKPGDVRGTLSGNNREEPKIVAVAYDFLIQSNETPVLQELAKKTGGLAAWGSSDVAKMLDVIREDFDSYYSLAYRATARSVDKSRTLVVKTARPGLVVRSRREVVEKSDTRRMKDRVIGALFRADDPAARLPFAVKLGKQEPARGRKLRIPVTIHIPVAALTVDSSDRGEFGVYVAWGSKVGGVSDATQERRTFSIPDADHERARRSFFTYEFTLAVNDATERIALGVSDETSKEYGVRIIDLAALRR